MNNGSDFRYLKFYLSVIAFEISEIKSQDQCIECLQQAHEAVA
jgi:hypothetical protein